MSVNIIIFATARVVCGRVCVTVRCPSVCLSHLLTAACRCGGFAAGLGEQEIATAAGRRNTAAVDLAARCSAAKASSDTSSAAVGS